MDSPASFFATAPDNLLPRYDELSKVAAGQLLREPFAYLWSPASLISETWIRLASVYDRDWVESSCPVSLWRRAMKNVLIDHARSQRADKRNWGTEVPDAYWTVPSTESHPEERLYVEKALEAIRQRSRRADVVVDMVFIQGHSIGKTATILKVNRRTVNRTLRTVREVLRVELAYAPSWRNHS
jgi:DNA-directed RNA polymerase specialized sigma24 family protein